jgi:hypothetical protein
MSEPTRGLLNTSVVIDHDVIDVSLLPDESAIAAITLAELAAGPHATNDDANRYCARNACADRIACNGPSRPGIHFPSTPKRLAPMRACLLLAAPPDGLAERSWRIC